MAKTLWLKNNKLIVDSEGKPILCQNCPCTPPLDLYNAKFYFDCYVETQAYNQLEIINYKNKDANSLKVKLPVTITWRSSLKYYDYIIPEQIFNRCDLHANFEVEEVSDNTMSLNIIIVDYFDYINRHSLGHNLISIILRFDGEIRNSDFTVRSDTGEIDSGTGRMQHGTEGGNFLTDAGDALIDDGYSFLYTETSSPTSGTTIYRIWETCGDPSKPEWGYKEEDESTSITYTGSGIDAQHYVWAPGSWIATEGDEIWVRTSSFDVLDNRNNTYYAWCHCGRLGQNVYAADGNTIYWIWEQHGEWVRNEWGQLIPNTLTTANASLNRIQIIHDNIPGEFA